MSQSHSRRRFLGMEPLEDRRVLAIFTVGSLSDSGPDTLRDAMQQANALPGEDTIQFAPSLSGGTINLASQLSVFDGVAVIAPPGGVTIDLSGADATPNVMDGEGIRAFSIITRRFTLDGFTISGGDVDGNGGAITSVATARVIVRNSVLTGNAAVRGGAIGSSGAELVIEDSELSGNVAGVGGAIHVSGTDNLEVTRTEIVENTVNGWGGGISTENTATVQISESEISFNSSIGEEGGGGMYMLGSTFSIADTSFDENSTRGSGGAIYSDGNNQGVMGTVVNSSITGNYASGRGGGVFSFLTSMNLTGAIVSGNEAGGSGGGIGGNGISIYSSSIESNSAGGTGGGAELSTVEGQSSFQVEDSTFAFNHSDSGGGGIVILQGGAFLRNSTFSGNTSNGGGGGALVQNSFGTSVLSMQHLTFVGNAADIDSSGGGSGGGLLIGGNTEVEISESIFASNFRSNLIPDDLEALTSLLQFNFNLIESTPTGVSISGLGNIIGVDPQLGPLADNGGPTQTHLPAASSIVVDAGNPSFVGDGNDQRGFGFGRIRDGDDDGTAVTDIGAVELPGTPAPNDLDGDGDTDGDDIDTLCLAILDLSGKLIFDIDGNGIVESPDFSLYLDLLGTKLGDANLDGSVDVTDFNIWNENKLTTNDPALPGVGWSSGDFNCDGVTDTSDFNSWNANKFTVADSFGIQPEEREARKSKTSLIDRVFQSITNAPR